VVKRLLSVTSLGFCSRFFYSFATRHCRRIRYVGLSRSPVRLDR